MLSVSPAAVAAIFAVLAVHWALSVFALYHLFSLRPKMVAAILLNIMIVVLAVVGPAGFLVWFFVSGKPAEIRRRNEREAAARKAERERAEEQAELKAHEGDRPSDSEGGSRGS